MGDQPDEASGSSNSRSTRMAEDIHWSQPCTGLRRSSPIENPKVELTRDILHELSLAYSFLIQFRNNFVSIQYQCVP